ncbi:MAG: tRNA uridine-5-carboxymethylaminomethyl(34) synthesis GTPase MnmE [Spirochaetota bacterium]|nr:tRNA uridine-5-carboxymethylaminomethyl(34) synthesis GTPase MnmE [Spirochaetota bacterium]
MINNKIIAAPSTAPGVAGVSMIRVSGANSITTVEKLFKSSKSLNSKKSHEIAYGKLFDPKTKAIIDEVMIGIFHHGTSFTGEESLEIWTHGSPYIVNEVMRILGTLGVSVADPGEFSLRAFLNGKIDLTQAEAIRDLTESQTKFAHAQAIGRLEGKLTDKIDLLHQETLDLLALLEVAIDHGEEEVDIEEVSNQFVRRIESLLTQVNHMLLGAQVGKMSTDGVKVALVGRPNVGKSSLLNTLVNENRVIVSDIAGTTRDVIEHRISARGLLIRFFDTAGLRETEDAIEKEGTKRSLEAIKNADLVIHVMDQSMFIQDEDKTIIKILQDSNKSILRVFNKNDLVQKLELDDTHPIIKVSAKDNKEIELIFDEIARFYFAGGVDPESDILVANIRQENLLNQSKIHLELAKTCILNQESEEFTASHIRKVRLSLEEIVGKTTDDAILDRIFSQFCIGK